MLIHNVFHVDENNHEVVPVASDSFPYVCIRTELDRYADKSITWHWHSAFEIVYVGEGEATVQTPEERILLQDVRDGIHHF